MCDAEHMRSTAALAVSLAALALFAGCTRDDQVATATAAPTAAPELTAPSTVVAPTTASATTQPPLTTPPTSVVSTRAPDTTAMATTTAVATTVAPTVPPTTVAPPAIPTDRVVYVQSGNTPIGVWDGSAWRYPEWDAADQPLLSAEVTTVVKTGLGLAEPITGVTFGPPDYFCVGDEVWPTLVNPPGADIDAVPVAVSADWDVQPRPVTVAGLDNPEYHAVGQSLVEARPGVDPASGTVTQVVRADLDGDGIEEVLFTFEHQTPDAPFGTLGDFVLIVARYPHADGSVDDVLVMSVYEEEPVDFPNPFTGELTAVADLNGDAVMEVITSATYWEGGDLAIYALVDGRLVLVAAGGCGV
jgi:hypothetical protein